MRLLFLFRAGGLHGLGHFVRTYCVAQEAKKRGHYVQLVGIVEAGPARDHIASCPEVMLVEDEQAAADAVRGEGSECLVVDAPALNLGVMLKATGSGIKVVSLSPIFSDMDKVNALVTRQSAGAVPDRVKVYSGLRFAVIRPGLAFITESPVDDLTKNNCLRIGISFGGTDPRNLTEGVLHRLCELRRNYRVDVCLGPGISYKREAVLRERASETTVVHRVDGELWAVLASCHVVVLGGGLTAFEAVKLGVPSVNVLYTREQERLLAVLADQGCTRTAVGLDGKGDDGLRGPSLLAQLISLVDDPAILREQRAECRSISWGNGARECVRAIEVECAR